MRRVLFGRAESRPEMERGVADDEPRIVILVAELLDVRQLGIRRDERRLGVPDVLEEELDESDTGHRALADEDSSAVQLRRGALGEEDDAPNGAVAGDREIGQQRSEERRVG